MRKIWLIAQTYMRQTFMSPIMLLMAFVMPLIFTAVLGAAFSGGATADNRLRVLTVDEDGGAIAKIIIEQLDNSEVVRPASGENLPATRAAALAKIDSFHRVLILPAGLSAAALAGKPVATELLVDANDMNANAAEQEIQAILANVNGAIGAAQTATAQAAAIQPFASEAEKTAYFQSALTSALQALANPTITVASEKATRLGTLDGNSQSSPGNLVTFGLVTLLATAIVLVEERNTGTLKRLVASPVSKPALLAGKTLGPLLVGIVQMAVLIAAGQILFGVQWGRSPLALVMVVVAFDLAAVSIGIFLSTIARTAEQATGMMVAASMVMGALGGAWWPLDIVPDFMRTAGHFFPSAWAMDGFQAIILRGASPAAVLLPTAVLLGFTVLFFGLGVWRFKYE